MPHFPPRVFTSRMALGGAASLCPPRSLCRFASAGALSSPARSAPHAPAIHAAFSRRSAEERQAPSLSRNGGGDEGRHLSAFLVPKRDRTLHGHGLLGLSHPGAAHALASVASAWRSGRFVSSNAGEGRRPEADRTQGTAPAAASRPTREEIASQQRGNYEAENKNNEKNEGNEKARVESVEAGREGGRSFRRWFARVFYSSLLLVGGGTAFLFFMFPSAPLDLKNGALSSILQAAAALRGQAKETPGEETGDGAETASGGGEAQKAEKRSAFAFLSKKDPLEGFSLVTDAEFDSTDEALVLFVDGETEAEAESENIRKLRSLVQRMQQDGKLGKDLRLFYAWRTPGNSPSRGEDTAVMLYKGQRRSRHALASLVREGVNTGARSTPATGESEGEAKAEEQGEEGEEESGEKILEIFFTPLSEKENTTRTKREKEKLLPVRVVGSAFKRDVRDEAKAGNTILLQLFEDSCFLCFLMRPFLNSVSKLLAEYNIPVAMKRLNIEKNDFPEGCVVTRATPTFVLYRGGHEEAEKWTEFRPRDFIEKLEKEFDLPVELREKLHALLDRLHERFKRFGLLSVWLLEVRKMEEAFLEHQQRNQERESLELHARGAPSAAGDSQEGNSDATKTEEKSREKEDKQREDGNFDAIVSMLMSQDMKRYDDLEENLDHLEREVANAEADAMALGVMMGEEVVRDDVEHLAEALLEAESRAGEGASPDGRPQPERRG
ncbi:conserved hypothetical protein [Neospora caninum Liverpool]|uniref:Thioredoxin, putative n=1 Tax=Neospora caninum (strain Liverpool) TaxID=572307 RepID=F0VPA2_NEOCL|nr:conserved hypothetical protein [Neospora caninum Liverpool]CBZ55548.1 conserved hypothetical protein [Neospora caninum Liverpool]CEL70288.1 TPA: thioredoxin, putative [Neospora caninum Liverpool]|eukprot:XP_003885576.1 conserved hypothetical protein [Neospora caninum Liverpool]